MVGGGICVFGGGVLSFLNAGRFGATGCCAQVGGSGGGSALGVAKEEDKLEGNGE